MKKKKLYERPTLKVDEPEHRTMILAGSRDVGATNSIDDWEDGDTTDDDIFL